ncbi:major facilitator superfamily domain-containing protein [Mrakia frigida]|uniref:major facilitator superfamily domain-containing protein n=1 Tax=Mrakia frigida TaxID=29902 RepID=UPI003FCC0A4B
MTTSLWNSFTALERRNMAIYIVGIMLYKLGLESFNGSIVTLATDRFKSANTFSKLGALTGLNQAMQVVGSVLIAPLIKRFPTKSVLSFAIVTFGLITTLFLIIDAATGGKMKTQNNNKVKYGSWDPNALFPLYMISGIAYGMVELIRRVIPRDLVGGDVQKLRKMDAIVHVLYEVAGTAGALLSVFMIKRYGNNYSFLITPPLFAVAGLAWWFVGTMGHVSPSQQVALDGIDKEHESYFKSVATGVKAFGRSTYKGAFIIFSDRKFIWLLPGYSFALYGHRYLENGIAPAIAKRIMLDSSYSQIMLFGALSVLLLTKHVRTPLPFLRFDALALLIVWYLPSYSHKIVPHVNLYAWKIAFSFIPISFGWAAGDVSLAAFIQASLARMESQDKEVSALGSVMAFLFSSYIILYAVLGSLLGKYIDIVFAEDKHIYKALVNVGGVQFTVLAAIVIAATFIPKGAFAFNPDIINDAHLDGEVDEEQNVNELDKDGKKRNSDSDEEYEKPVKTTDVGAML